MRGRHGQLNLGGDDDPGAGTEKRAKHTKHECRRLIGVHIGISNTLRDRIKHSTTHKHSAGKLKDGRNADSLPQLERLGAHRGTKSVGDVIGADAKSHHKGGNKADNYDPHIVLGKLVIRNRRDGRVRHKGGQRVKHSSHPAVP